MVLLLRLGVGVLFIGIAVWCVTVQFLGGVSQSGSFVLIMSTWEGLCGSRVLSRWRWVSYVGGVARAVQLASFHILICTSCISDIAYISAVPPGRFPCWDIMSRYVVGVIGVSVWCVS